MCSLRCEGRWDAHKCAGTADMWWGMTYTLDRIRRSDLDPALLVWGLCRRVDLNSLPDRRIVLRFEFSGVPASRTKFRIMWLILERSGVDVCMKDPGFGVDLTLRGNILDYVEVYLGHTKWCDVAGTRLQFQAISGLQGRSPSGCDLSLEADEMCAPSNRRCDLFPLTPVIPIGRRAR
jgi:hypothetical protein